MPIYIFHWRRQIGNFNNRSSFSRCTFFLDFSIMSLFKLLIKFLCCIMLQVSILLLPIYTVITFCKSVICIYNRHILYFSLLANYLCRVWLCKLHVNLSRDIELNPGPKSNSRENYSVCHWNLNSISAHNFSKVLLLNAYSSLHSFDIICLSETYLDSSILSHNPNLEVQGCDLIGADHPSNVKKGELCIYYKNHLPLKLININFLHDCLTIELNIKNKLCVFVALYRSPSKSCNEFYSFNSLNYGIG